MKKPIIITGILVFLFFLVALAATTIDDFFLPGSQIGQSGNIETPDRCDNCHGGYDQAVEPAFNWRGSMMSQAARDPLFYACLAIANQDAPDVGDMCLRCHAPDGWLNGRCVPTDGSALNNNDRQGVQCDFCHKMVKPSPLGTNPFPGNTAYLNGTYSQDQSYLSILDPIPPSSSNGMYIADANNAKRGPFTDATGRHQMFYSPFHSQSEHCGTCHDVSNPAFTRESTSVPVYTYNEEGMPSPTFDLRLMLPVERTYSEWLISDYNGVLNKTCQDCHMRDVTGKGAKMKDAPLRTNLPLHDMTGGNTFIPNLVKIQSASEVNPAALDAGVLRARSNLQSAATFELTVEGSVASVKVTNNTGHKLPTGYPEGRRIWINMKFMDGSGNLISESGAYNYETAELAEEGTKIYETHPGISPELAAVTGLPAGKSFHFVLNDMVYFDNRIPPAGFTNQELIDVQSPVVGDGVYYPDGQNWDVTSYTLPEGTAKVEARLFYQTTTKEYVEFLDTNNHTNTRGQEMYDLWLANGKSAPELMAYASYPQVTQLIANFVTVGRTTSKQGSSGYAVILVTCDGVPVEGVAVSASYSGPNSGTASGTTGSDGLVTLETRRQKSPVGTWCFTLTSVTKNGYTPPPDPLPTGCEPAEKVSGDESPALVFDIRMAPNPVNSVASVTYSIPEPGRLEISVYDQTGRRVDLVVSGYHDIGTYTYNWDASGLPAGIYLVRMQTADKQIVRKIMLTR